MDTHAFLSRLAAALEPRAARFGWSAGKTRSGGLKALGVGPSAGKVLYGERARKALAGRAAKATVDETHAHVKSLTPAHHADPAAMKALAARLLGHTHAELKQLRDKLGFGGSGTKQALADAITRQAGGAKVGRAKKAAPPAKAPESAGEAMAGAFHDALGASARADDDPLSLDFGDDLWPSETHGAGSSADPATSSPSAATKSTSGTAAPGEYPPPRGMDRMPGEPNPLLHESARAYLADPDQSFAASRYAGSHYEQINGALRDGEEPDGEAGEYHRQLQKAFAAARPLPAPVEVKRGLDFRKPAELEAFVSAAKSAVRSGVPLVHLGYASTTTGSADADEGFDGNVELRIKARHGLDLSPASALDEREFLLPHGTSLRVSRVEEVPARDWKGKKIIRHVIHAEQLLPPDVAARMSLLARLGWSAAKTRSGGVKALGVGPQAGKVLYGARARAALAHHERKERAAAERAAPAVRAKGGRPTVDEAHAHVKEHHAALAGGAPMEPSRATELAGYLQKLSLKDLHELRRRLGVSGSGVKASVARKVAERTLEKPDAAPREKRSPKEPWRPAGVPKAVEPGRVYNVPTAGLKVDPDRFQFKLDAKGPAGVTDEFKGVKAFNPDFAGVISAWRDPADGKDYVVNGHHRHELASRTGHPELAVRYLSAKNAEEARAKGALVNIAEGRGTAIDAAKFMRDSGTTPADFEALGVSLKGAVARDAGTLARLSPRLFQMTTAGMIDQDRALAIAGNLPDGAAQEKLYDYLDKQESKSGKELPSKVVAEMAREMAATPTTTKTEATLFGDDTREESLFAQRAELKAHVRQELGKELKDFQAVSSDRRAANVAKAGNTLNVAQNKALAHEAAGAKELYDRLVNSKGPVSETINQFAGEYADAKTQKQRDEVKRRAVQAVRAAVSDVGALRVGADAGGSAAGEAPAAAAPDDGGADLFGAGVSEKVGEALAGAFHDALGAPAGANDSAPPAPPEPDAATAPAAELRHREDLLAVKPGDRVKLPDGSEVTATRVNKVSVEYLGPQGYERRLQLPPRPAPPRPAPPPAAHGRPVDHEGFIVPAEGDEVEMPVGDVVYGGSMRRGRVERQGKKLVVRANDGKTYPLDRHPWTVQGDPNHARLWDEQLERSRQSNAKRDAAGADRERATAAAVEDHLARGYRRPEGSLTPGTRVVSVMNGKPRTGTVVNAEPLDDGNVTHEIEFDDRRSTGSYRTGRDWPADRALLLAPDAARMSLGPATASQMREALRALRLARRGPD